MSYEQSGWLAYLDVQYKISEKGYLMVEFPYGSGEITDKVRYQTFDINTQQNVWVSEKNSFSNHTIGNMFAGYKVNLGTGSNSMLIGVSIPLVDKKETLIPLMLSTAAAAEKYSAFVPNIIAIKALFNYSPAFNSIFSINFGIGPDVWYLTRKTSGDKIEVFAIYYIKAGFETEKLSFFAGLMNVSLLTGSKLSFSDATNNQFLAEAKYKIGRFIPFVGYRKYLSKTSDNYLGAVNIGLGCYF